MSKFSPAIRCKVAHLTSVHPRNDTRIFLKQCRSLSKFGYEVSLVVADGNGGVSLDGVNIVDAGKLSGRLNRIFRTTRNVFQAAVDLDADIYHLHDPELIPVGVELKRRRKKVIFDAHEDFPSQLLGKSYLNPLLSRCLSWVASALENSACRCFDGVIAATPFIREKFLNINPNTIDINNFPMLGELDVSLPWSEKNNEFCYIGGIGAIRGVRELISACQLLKTSSRLNLAGRFFEPDIELEVKSNPGWGRVNELGYLDRAGIRTVLERSVAGLVTLHPAINYLDSLPVKMFEYMAAGIPVIASNFQLWREIVEKNNCGICVDPLNPSQIAAAVDMLVSDRDLARSLGDNGRRLILEKYNWSVEEAKLFDFYKGILAKDFPI